MHSSIAFFQALHNYEKLSNITKGLPGSRVAIVNVLQNLCKLRLKQGKGVKGIDKGTDSMCSSISVNTYILGDKFTT